MADLPNKAWYVSQSKKSKLPHHCPIASITGCPRYFASLDHAQQAKLISGEVPRSVRDHLLEKWACEDALLIDDLQVGTYYKPNGNLSGGSNFCPEVVGLLNGLYCSDFRSHPDDQNSFSFVQEKHYSQCSEFAVHGYETKNLQPVDRGITPGKRYRIFKRDDSKCVYCGRSSLDVLLHIDHKISRADGGGDEISNLVTACSLCNNGKGRESAI